MTSMIELMIQSEIKHSEMIKAKLRDNYKSPQTNKFDKTLRERPQIGLPIILEVDENETDALLDEEIIKILQAEDEPNKKFPTKVKADKYSDESDYVEMIFTGNVGNVWELPVIAKIFPHFQYKDFISQKSRLPNIEEEISRNKKTPREGEVEVQVEVHNDIYVEKRSKVFDEVKQLPREKMVYQDLDKIETISEESIETISDTQETVENIPDSEKLPKAQIETDQPVYYRRHEEPLDMETKMEILSRILDRINEREVKQKKKRKLSFPKVKKACTIL